MVKNYENYCLKYENCFQHQIRSVNIKHKKFFWIHQIWCYNIKSGISASVALQNVHLPITWQESELMFRNNGLFTLSRLLGYFYPKRWFLLYWRLNFAFKWCRGGIIQSHQRCCCWYRYTFVHQTPLQLTAHSLLRSLWTTWSRSLAKQSYFCHFLG